MNPSGVVHPAAALFPMMSADELADLADDIKANGLLQPIVLDAEGTLIDGRNRLAACKLAKVKPRFAQLNGQDPTAYILASNVMRRHMTHGQRAMVVAKTYYQMETKDVQVAHLSHSEAARIAGVPRRRIIEADLILKHAPEQVDSVISAAVYFDVAYRLAQAREDEYAAVERRAEEERRQLALLQERALDLAELVIEERMSLEEAMAVYGVRYREELDAQQKAFQSRQRMTANFVQAITMIDGVLLTDPERIAREWEPSGVGLLGEPERMRRLWTADGMRTVAQRLMILADTADLEKGGSLG